MRRRDVMARPLITHSSHGQSRGGHSQLGDEERLANSRSFSRASPWPATTGKGSGDETEDSPWRSSPRISLLPLTRPAFCPVWCLTSRTDTARGGRINWKSLRRRVEQGRLGFDQRGRWEEDARERGVVAR
jgi:hypothetical protein